MPKSNLTDSSEELIRVHVWLYRSDVERIDDLWGQSLGRSAAIRTFVRKYLRIMEEKVNKKSKTPTVDMEA